MEKRIEKRYGDQNAPIICDMNGHGYRAHGRSVNKKVL